MASADLGRRSALAERDVAKQRHPTPGRGSTEVIKERSDLYGETERRSLLNIISHVTICGGDASSEHGLVAFAA
jgi:hypothetical protein